MASSNNASSPNLLFTSKSVFPQFNIIPGCPASDFPTDVLKKIKENATETKQSLKLMKCNKFFCYLKFPWLVVKEFSNDGSGYHYKTLDGKWHKSSENISNKLWVKKKIFCVDRCIPLLIEKINVCDVRKLILNGQNISYDDFKFFTASGRIQKLKIFGGVWKDVMINQILKLVPNVSSFQFVNDFPATSFERRFSESPPTSSFETKESRLRIDKTLFPFHPTLFSDIAEVINPLKLKHFKLAFIPYVADFHVFIEFIKEHPKIEYEFYFTGKQSKEESQMLKDFSNQIKENGLITDGSRRLLPPPIIHYGQTQKSHREMWNLIYMPYLRKSLR